MTKSVKTKSVKGPSTKVAAARPTRAVSPDLFTDKPDEPIRSAQQIKEDHIAEEIRLRAVGERPVEIVIVKPKPTVLERLREWW